MKLHRIEIENFQMLRTLSIDLTKAPICLVAGRNEQGKSSLLEAVRMALTGTAARVKLKKDYSSLVRDGAKKGTVSVESDKGSFSVALPTGKCSAEDSSPFLPFLLDSSRFAALSENDRRAFLLSLTGQGNNLVSVKEKMLDRGCDPEKIESILPLLRSGFPAAEKEASGRATEAKGAWRAVTGETYGPAKAEGWKSEAITLPSAESIEALNAEYDNAQTSISALEQEIGAARAAREEETRQTARKAGLKEKAQRFAHIADQVNRAQQDLDEFLPKIDVLRQKANIAALPEPRSCPHCKASIYDIGGELVIACHDPEFDPEAAARLPDYEKSLKVLENALASRKRDLEEADTAAKQLEALQKDSPVLLSDEEFATLKSHLDIKKDALRTLASDLSKISEQQKQAKDADKKTADAKKHYDDVLAWEKIAATLAPDGIPGESINAAREVFNARLRTTAERSGWAQVSIDPEMAVRVDGRLYSLCSESARWRADAALTEAISNISGLRLFALDRVDVLDGDQRLACLKWLHVLAQTGEIETAIITGTFKAPPACPGTFAVHWLEQGEFVLQKIAA